MTPPIDHGGAPRGSTEQSGDRDGNRALWAGVDSGWVMVVELITAVFTWGGIGWFLDRWLGTAPWLLVTGFVIGWATGFYLVWFKFSRDDSAAATRGATEEGSERATDAGT